MSNLSQFEEAFKGTQAYSNLWLGKATGKDVIFERLDTNQYVIDEVESARIMWEFCMNKSQKTSQEVEQLIDERDAVTEKAEALKDKLQALYGVDFGEHSNANCPFQNAIEYDDSSLIEYMKEREAFYQNWKDSRNSIEVNICHKTVELTGSEKTEYLDALKNQIKGALIEMEQDQRFIASECLLGTPVGSRSIVAYDEDQDRRKFLSLQKMVLISLDEIEYSAKYNVFRFKSPNCKLGKSVELSYINYGWLMWQKGHAFPPKLNEEQAMIDIKTELKGFILGEDLNQ